MAPHPQNRPRAASPKVYGWLLRAYPPAHREAFGPAMAQLFCDQHRDAWSEAQRWGVAKLWLRILPDLARTSILERLAALKERKTMADKLANLFSFRPGPAAAFFPVFAAVFLVVFLISVVITYLQPEIYASTARIRVEPDAPATAGSGPAYDPYFIQTTLEIIPSELVLKGASENLNLNVRWGKKYFNGETLRTAETLKILKQRLQIAPVRNTKLIAITAYSDDRKEAAAMANAVAAAYRDYRRESRPAPLEKNDAQKLEAELPKNSPVQIIDTAEPGRAPVKPNKPLNLIIGAVAGGFLGLVTGGLSALAAAKTGNRGRKST